MDIKWIVLTWFLKTFAARPVVLVAQTAFFVRSQICSKRKDFALPAFPVIKVSWQAKVTSSTCFWQSVKPLEAKEHQPNFQTDSESHDQKGRQLMRTSFSQIKKLP